MEQIPTAKEASQKWEQKALDYLKSGGKSEEGGNLLEQAFIEFAKLHVEAALKAASMNAHIYNRSDEEDNAEIDMNSILSAYPLDKII